MIRRLSVNEFTTNRWTLEQDVENYAALGFDGISVCIGKLKDCGVERAIETLRKHKLPVASLCGSPQRFTSRDPREVEAGTRDTLEAIELAGMLGTNCVAVYPSVPHGLDGQTRRHAEDAAVAGLQRVLPEARKKGIRLAIEPLHSMYVDYLNTLEEAMRIVCRLDDENVGLLLDVYQVWQEGGLLDRIRSVGPHIFLVHISDWREPTRSGLDRLIPGEGRIHWQPIMRAIEATGYQGFYEVEVVSEDLWKTDYVDLLRRCKKGFASFWD